MANIDTPSFTLAYWRPWSDNYNFIDAYSDFLRDTSLVKYGASLVNSKIEEVGKHLGYQLEDISSQLRFGCRRLDDILHQQEVANMLLKDISGLLKISDSEKERAKNISWGLKFYSQGVRDNDLYSDALKYFLLAEQQCPTDYFVLHKIGCIYLYIAPFVDVTKALEYFKKAAKYAVADSDSDLCTQINSLFGHNSEYKDITANANNVNFLAADSYAKCAFSNYIIGDDALAIIYQQKALDLVSSPRNTFILAKYLYRNGQTDKADQCLYEAINADFSLSTQAIIDPDFSQNDSALKIIDKVSFKIDDEFKHYHDNVAHTPVVKDALAWAIDNIGSISKWQVLRSSNTPNVKNYYRYFSEYHKYARHNGTFDHNNIKEIEFEHDFEVATSGYSNNSNSEQQLFRIEYYMDITTGKVKAILCYEKGEGKSIFTCRPKEIAELINQSVIHHPDDSQIRVYGSDSWCHWCLIDYSERQFFNIYPVGVNPGVNISNKEREYIIFQTLADALKYYDVYDYYYAQLDNSKWGVVDNDMNVIINFSYNSVEELDNSQNEYISHLLKILKANNICHNIIEKTHDIIYNPGIDNKRPTIANPTPENDSLNKTKKGCYIASCIYGSYNCPEVWTLRRFRDNTLDTKWYGRLFIKIYYAVSPTIVSMFGNAKWFRKVCKIILDNTVAHLQNKGVECSIYEDK